jgi:hypothetical protein
MVNRNDLAGIAKKGVHELERQRAAGRKQSTAKVKANARKAGGDPNLKYSRISSGERRDDGSYTGSLRTYVNDWAKVANQIRKMHPEVNTLQKITSEMVKEVIENERRYGGIGGTGASEKTLKGYVSAVNHVMVGSNGHFWKPQEKLALSDIYGRRDTRFGGNKEPHGKAYGTVYKDLTASEWRAANPDAYERNRKLVDTNRAFGLRNREIFGTRGRGEYGLTDRSFVINNGRIGVETVGKGGKYRVAWARRDMNQQMLSIFGSMARVFRSDLTQEQRSRGFNAITRNGHKIFYRSHEFIPTHINRAEYAQQLLRERIAIWEHRYEQMDRTGHIAPHRGEFKGYSRLTGSKLNELHGLGYETTIANYSGPIEAFQEVSQQLGHNRLDVLLTYLSH